jgi:nitrile hydratase alpha subunit
MSAITSRRQVEDILIRKAYEDSAFKRALIEQPNATISQELGVRIPSEISISVVEESPHHLYLVLPPAPAAMSGELSDRELSAVAGGADDSAWGKVKGFFGDGGDTTLTEQLNKTSAD